MNRVVMHIRYDEQKNRLYLCEDIKRIGELLFGALGLNGSILHISETNKNIIFKGCSKTTYDKVSQYVKYNTRKATISERSSISKASFGYNSCIGFHIEGLNSGGKKYTTLSHIRTLDMDNEEKSEIIECYKELAFEAKRLGLKYIRIQLVGGIARYFDYEKEYNYNYFISRIQSIFVKVFGSDGFIDQPEMKEEGFEHYVCHEDSSDLLLIRNVI